MQSIKVWAGDVAPRLEHVRGSIPVLRQLCVAAQACHLNRCHLIGGDREIEGVIPGSMTVLLLSLKDRGWRCSQSHWT